MIKKITLLIIVTVLCSGCISSRWEVEQLETTFMNEEDQKEFVQKNAILLNKQTGETWVFESDGESNYYWQALSVKAMQ